MYYDDLVYMGPANAQALVTEEELRNATRPYVVSHSAAGTRPVGRVGVVPTRPAAVSSPRYVYAQPAPQVGIWSGYRGEYAAAYPPVPVQYPYPPNNLASILGGFGDIGSLTDIAAKVVAAFMPMPNPPDPRMSQDSDTFLYNAAANSADLITYQTALAKFARRDQQILTLGSVLKELFKRPVG